MGLNTMRYKSVCLLGGSGFVGKHIASRLTAKGYHVLILTSRASHCNELRVLPNLNIIEIDIHNQSQLNTATANVDMIINLVGILNEKQHNGDGFRRAHIQLVHKIISACHYNKITRLIQMSALNADASHGTSHYLRTKGEAENLIHSFSTDIDVTSFRPSVIFGTDDSFFNRFASILKLSPLIFPLACAQAKFAPIHVEEVAEFFVDAISNKASFGKRIDLCGPETYTLKELVCFTSQQIGRKHWIISLPDSISKLQANLLEYVPGKPFSVDNYNSLKVDSICHQRQLYTARNSIQSIVPGYLGQKNKFYRDDQFRQHSRRNLLYR